MTDVFQKLIEKKVKIRGSKYTGKWAEVDSLKDYMVMKKYLNHEKNSFNKTWKSGYGRKRSRKRALRKSTISKSKLLEIGLDNADIYSSPFRRAIQTIKPFADTNKNISITESHQLEEIHMPKDENLSKHQVIEKMWEDENFKISEGLSHREHFVKIEPFLSNIFDNFKSNNKDLVIITHGV